jgi:hypothetical protein
MIVTEMLTRDDLARADGVKPIPSSASFAPRSGERTA